MFKGRSESLDKRIPPSIEAPIKNTLEMCFLALNIETSGKSTSCIGYKNPSPLPCMGLDDVAVSSSLRLFAFKSSKVGLVMEDSLFVAVGAWIATVPTLTPLVGFFKCVQLIMVRITMQDFTKSLRGTLHLCVGQAFNTLTWNNCAIAR